MRINPTMLVCMMVLLSGVAWAQAGIRGQIFLPNGSPLQRQTPFTLRTEDGQVNETFYTDSNGRIAIPQPFTRFTIIVDSDDATYDTTTASFDTSIAGRTIIVNLRPLSRRASTPGTVDIETLDKNVSSKAREAYASATKLLEAGQLEKAIEPLKQAISHQSNYFRAYNDLGVVYMKLNHLDEAAEAFRQAIKINNKIYYPQLNLGIVLNRSGKFKEAADVLGKLQQNNPELRSAHAPLVESFIGLQDWARAEAEIKKALEVKGADKVDLKVKLGMVSLRAGKFSQARAALGEAVAAEPDNALAQFNYGAALLQTGAFDEAEAALKAAYKLEGAKMAGAQLLLGQVYFQKKDYAKAIEAFESYLKEMPDAPNANQVKESIKKLRDAMKN
jgi:tetratricopeptide (TPR) repeat protein